MSSMSAAWLRSLALLWAISLTAWQSQALKAQTSSPDGPTIPSAADEEKPVAIAAALTQEPADDGPGRELIEKIVREEMQAEKDRQKAADAAAPAVTTTVIGADRTLTGRW